MTRGAPSTRPPSHGDLAVAGGGVKRPAQPPTDADTRSAGGRTHPSDLDEVLRQLAEAEGVAADLRVQVRRLAGPDPHPAATLDPTGRQQAAVVHELRNLITPALAYLQIAARPGTPIDQVRRAASRAHAALERAGDTAHVVLQAVRHNPSQGDETPQPPEAPVRGLVGEVAAAVDAMRAVAEQRGVHLIFDAQTEPPVQPRTPPQTIYAVMLNLLRNAVAAAPVRIRVRVIVEVSRVEVRVEDDGCGCQEWAGAVSAGIERAVGGAGLGLMISRRMLSPAGGTLSLEPRDGGGTLARVVLPLGGSRRSSAAPQATQAGA